MSVAESTSVASAGLEPPAPMAPGPAALRPARRRGGVPRALLALARPLQWTKNLIVVPLALAISPDWTLTAAARIGWSMLVFTLASVLVYGANDIVDRHRDRAHPDKRHRPIAAGQLPVTAAVVFCAVVATTLIAATVLGPSMPYWPVLTYLALNVAYSRGLKHRALIDIGIVAAGFVLRAAQGTLAGGGELSTWLLLAVFSICLILILGKRRSELLVAGTAHRPALRGYTVPLIDQFLQLAGGLTVVAVLIYLHNDAGLGRFTPVATLLCVPFLLFGLARYLQAMLLQHSGGDPVRALVTDRSLRTAVLAWAMLLLLLMLQVRAPALAGQLMP